MLTGLLLGAGASFECGMPMVGELSKAIRSELTPDTVRSLNAVARSGNTAVPEAILEDFIKLLGMDCMHYESIIGNLQVNHLRNSTDRENQHHYRLASWMTGNVYRYLYHQHIKYARIIERMLRHIDGITGLAAENRPLWIFSLNHDLIIECLAAQYKIPIRSGHTGRISLPLPNGSHKGITQINAQIIVDEDFHRGNSYFSHGTSGINLIKLHGSLDIFACGDMQKSLKLLPTQEGAKGVLEAIKLLVEKLPFRPPLAPQAGIINGVVYLDETGEIQFLDNSIVTGSFKFTNRIGQEPVPNDYLNHFDSFILHLQKLICIGYGFGDAHVNRTIRRWLEISRGYGLEIVDPMRTNVPADLLHLAPQIKLVKLSATKYLESFAPKPYSKMERLERCAIARLLDQQRRK